VWQAKIATRSSFVELMPVVNLARSGVLGSCPISVNNGTYFSTDNPVM
jgi:hypothetical protein